MTGDFITKRPHKKSRGGCTTCKTRKVKCNEAQPTCGFCAKRNLPCIYVPKSPKTSSSSSATSSQSGQTSEDESPPSPQDTEEDDISWDLVAAPTPTIMTSGGGLSVKDLQLVHQWSTITASSVTYGAPACNALRFSVPQLAFEHEFLLNGMLGIAAFHEERYTDDKQLARRRTDVYRIKALSSFRQAITVLNIGTTKYEAALIMAILLVVLYSDPADGEELLIINWLTMYRGLSAIMNMSPQGQCEELSVWPVFDRQGSVLTFPPVIPKILVNMLAEIRPPDPDFPMLEYWCQVLDALGMLYAALRQDGITPALSVRIIAWPSYTTQKFADCARERRPRVLVILTYYLAFTKLASSLWWIEGIADREIKAIANILGPEWLRYMSVPVRITQMTDVFEIANLLLA